MDKWFKDILPDKDPYHNRGRDQMRKKGVRNSSACGITGYSVWTIYTDFEYAEFSSKMYIKTNCLKYSINKSYE